jgi:hypothetical protein
LKRTRVHYPDEGLGVDNPFHLWQASVYATKYARQIAAQMYGTAPVHGYVNGCSGGGLRTAVHLENAPDLFAGAVPQAWGLNQRPNWSIYGLATTLLRDKLPEIIDAAEVGGSGDIYRGLNPQQRAALETMYGLGWPRQAASQMQFGWAQAPFSLYNVMDADPQYYKDFWEQPGYLGRDDSKEVEPLVIDTTLTVERTVTQREMRAQGTARSSADTATFGAEAGTATESRPAAILNYPGDLRDLFMAKATILSGPDAGKSMYLSGRREKMMLPFTARAPYAFTNVKAGETIRVDNRDWIAYMYYHRYGLQALTAKLQLQTPKFSLMFPEHRAIMKPDGKPIYPQRTAATGWYPGLNGTFTDKMIMLSGTADEPIWPTQMTPYERMVRRHLGAKVDETYRFWWLDHVPHCSGPLEGPRSTRTVPNTGVVAQAIRDVVRWAEEGVAPAASITYHYADDNALVLAPTAKERRGIQPVVTLAVNGGVRAEVRAGTPVTLTASAEVPAGSGTIVRAQFDFDGQGTWPQARRCERVVANVDDLSDTRVHEARDLLPGDPRRLTPPGRGRPRRADLQPRAGQGSGKVGCQRSWPLNRKCWLITGGCYGPGVVHGAHFPWSLGWPSWRTAARGRRQRAAAVSASRHRPALQLSTYGHACRSGCLLRHRDALTPARRWGCSSWSAGDGGVGDETEGQASPDAGRRLRRRGREDHVGRICHSTSGSNRRQELPRSDPAGTGISFCSLLDD